MNIKKKINSRKTVYIKSLLIDDEDYHWFWSPPYPSRDEKLDNQKIKNIFLEKRFADLF
jgi:hypothetical protein